MIKYLLLLLPALLLASCFKYIKVDNNLQYKVLGLQNITIDQNDSARVGVEIELLSGDPANEYITMTVGGVPAGVSVNQDSLVFRPNYGFYLAFYAHGPNPGVYPVTITMVSPTLGTRVYTFNLTVTSLFDCTQQFSASQQYIFLDNKHTAQVAGSAATNVVAYENRTGCDTLNVQVMIDSMVPGGGGDPALFPMAEFKAVVNCAANTLTIFPQSTGYWAPQGQMIKGQGTYVPVTDSTATITVTATIYSGTEVISTNTFTIY